MGIKNPKNSLIRHAAAIFSLFSSIQLAAAGGSKAPKLLQLGRNIRTGGRASYARIIGGTEGAPEGMPEIVIPGRRRVSLPPVQSVQEEPQRMEEAPQYPLRQDTPELRELRREALRQPKKAPAAGTSRRVSRAERQFALGGASRPQDTADFFERYKQGIAQRVERDLSEGLLGERSESIFLEEPMLPEPVSERVMMAEEIESPYSNLTLPESVHRRVILAEEPQAEQPKPPAKQASKKTKAAKKPSVRSPKKPGSFVDPSRLREGALPAYIPVTNRKYIQREVSRGLIKAGVPKGPPRAAQRKTIYPKIGQGLVEKTVSGELQTGLPLSVLQQQVAKQTGTAVVPYAQTSSVRKATPTRPSTQRRATQPQRKPQPIQRRSTAVVPAKRAQAVAPVSQAKPEGMISTIGGQPVNSQFLSLIKAGNVAPEIVVRYQPGLQGQAGMLSLDELNAQGLYNTTTWDMSKFVGSPMLQRAAEGLIRAGKQVMYAFYQPKKLPEIGSAPRAQVRAITSGAQPVQAEFGDPLARLLDMMRDAKTVVLKLFEPQQIQPGTARGQSVFRLQDFGLAQDRLKRTRSSVRALNVIDQREAAQRMQQARGAITFEPEIERQPQELQEIREIAQVLESQQASVAPVITEFEQAQELPEILPIEHEGMPQFQEPLLEGQRIVEGPISMELIEPVHVSTVSIEQPVGEPAIIAQGIPAVEVPVITTEIIPEGESVTSQVPPLGESERQVELTVGPQEEAETEQELEQIRLEPGLLDNPVTKHARAILNALRENLPILQSVINDIESYSLDIRDMLLLYNRHARLVYAIRAWPDMPEPEKQEAITVLENIKTNIRQMLRYQILT